jgi:primosomal protein N' (replication factor Y)
VPHVRVALSLSGALGDVLTYSASPSAPPPGSIVTVRVRNRLEPGVVLGEVPEPEFSTKAIESRLDGLRLWPPQLQVAEWMAAHYRAPLFECIRLLLPAGFEARLRKGAPARAPRRRASEDLVGYQVEPRPAFLSQDQDDARNLIASAIRANRSEVFLLHGVTGSGKTHVYLESAAEALQRGLQVLILVSDISLTPEAVSRIERRFPGKVGLLHGSMGDGERERTWRDVADGNLSILVGARSAIFAPLRRLGLIIIDEEHEPSYKQDAMPRYHARDVAVELGRVARAPIVLSSATPSVESYYLAEQGIYRLLSLPSRVGSVTGGKVTVASLPSVEIVDMRREARAGETAVLSRALALGIHETLGAGLQVMLFLNRRGTASALGCRSCGTTVDCRRCSVPMALHQPLDLIICHRCGRRRPVPEKCPACSSERLLPVGVGVQRVESEVKKLQPEARVIRWDRDTTGKRGSHEQLYRSFLNREADILVGTQMIGKGLDFPTVGMVGIVLAESGLFLPDFRAAERTYQILTQVAGRAGRRADAQGRVVLQSYVPEHYAIRAAANHDYLDLYRREIGFRHQQAYPPFRALTRLVLTGAGAQAMETEAGRVTDEINRRCADLGLADLQIIGPAPAFVHRLRGRYRWSIVLAGRDAGTVLDAVPLSRGWSVDVDPMDLL